MPALETIQQFLAMLEADKTAEAHTEPGSMGGPTTHPSKDVDDSTETATEGARSAENEKDVKEEIGPASVDSTADAKAASLLQRLERFMQPVKGAEEEPPGTGTAADDQLQIGTRKSPTGGDPSIETSSAKAGKKDSPSSHPARTDNDALNGGKYAVDANTSFDKIASALEGLGNELLATLSQLPGAGTPAAPATKAAAVAAAPLDAELARQAGFELAGLFSGDFDKQAADRLVVGRVHEIVTGAHKRANDLADYLEAYYAQKAAAGENDPADPAQPGGDGGPPLPGHGSAPSGDPGGGAGGGAPPGAAAMLGGDPGAGGPGAGDGDGDDQDIEMILQAVQSLGISPEQLAQAMAAQGGGGGGGMGGTPPGGGMGGMPPGGAPPGAMDPAAGGMPGGMPAAAPGGGPGPGMETSAADRGANQLKWAMAQSYIRELASRSRRRGA